MLTVLQVKNAKCPPDKEFLKLWDAGGLHLLVTPGGSRLWHYKYRFKGKEKLLSLGTFPKIELAAARLGLASAKQLLAQGIDPNQQKQDLKREKASGIDRTFASLAEAWFKQKQARWSQASAGKARLYLNLDLLPELGHRPIAEIRRIELIDVLRKIENREAFNVARKCRGWLHGIFKYALASDVIEANPATDLSVVAKPAPPPQSYPHLNVSELPDFLKALDGYKGALATTHAIRLLLMTAVRPGELRAARWDEFDLDNATWNIPAARMKMRRRHSVPLPSQAIEYLRELFADRRGHGLVFASTSDPSRCMSENTVNNAISRLGYKGRQVGHGFRHLVSTALNERGYNRDWIERQLAHGDPDQIRAIYNKAEYLDQRRVMMQAWADDLDELRKR